MIPDARRTASLAQQVYIYTDTTTGSSVSLNIGVLVWFIRPELCGQPRSVKVPFCILADTPWAVSSFGIQHVGRTWEAFSQPQCCGGMYDIESCLRTYDWLRE